jgi:CheY-like chemotaxis protein
VSTAERAFVVLVVEDNADLLDLLVRSLNRIGHFTVIGASDGIAGLDRFTAVRPDCVVIDVKMPGLDGFQLVRAIRGDPETASTPLIILTAMAQDKDQFAGLAAGADLYLLKPITPQDLAAAIHHVIQLDQAERERRMRALADDQSDNAF